MMNLKNLLTKRLSYLLKPLQLEKIPKWIPIVLLVLAFIGFADATFLAAEHYRGVIPPCSIGGCETVLNSKYAAIFGVPVSLLGALYYLTIAVLLFIYFDTKKEVFLKIPLHISITGFIFSLYFMTVMFFVLKAFCPYCVVSALTSLSIFGFSAFGIYKNDK